MEEHEANNYVLQYAVMRQISCPTCNGVLDQRDSTLLLAEGEGGAMVLHTACIPACFSPAESTEVIRWVE